MPFKLSGRFDEKKKKKIKNTNRNNTVIKDEKIKPVPNRLRITYTHTCARVVRNAAYNDVVLILIYNNERFVRRRDGPPNVVGTTVASPRTTTRPAYLLRGV